MNIVYHQNHPSPRSTVALSGLDGTGGGGGGAVGYSNNGHGGKGIIIFTAPKDAVATFTPGVTSTNVISSYGRTYTVNATSNQAQTFYFTG